MRDYDVYSKFDLEKHKMTFVNYFEAIILPTGEVQYAIPSHQEALIRLAFPNFTRDEAWEQVPIVEDPINFLLIKTGCISCWSNFHIGAPCTPEQEEMLQILINEGLTK